jgi:FAD-dependent urate hydroxylase
MNLPYPTTKVVVVGAGPYGLSIAAHLRERGIPFRIFGVAMQNWRTAMPKGMFLKSEGAGSNLSDPAHVMTLAQHCVSRNLTYSDRAMPIALETFVDYGLAFQRQLVPELEECKVVSLAGKLGAFDLRLDTSEALSAGRVVLAVGTTYFGHIPAEFAGLPPGLISHSHEHSDFTKFSQKDVVVIGGGQSALETAALLDEQSARVHVLVRRTRLAWNPLPQVSPQTATRRFLHPRSALGEGWKAWFYCNAPGVFFFLPKRLRTRIVQSALGPAGAWWLRDRIEGKFPVSLGHIVRQAREKAGRVCLSVARQDGQLSEICADHVIAATGYKVDVGSLPFLETSLLKGLRHYQGAPLLSSDFECSIPGLYFTGLAAAQHFGPSMRFVVGADYAARKISNACQRPTVCRVSVQRELSTLGNSLK